VALAKNKTGLNGAILWICNCADEGMSTACTNGAASQFAISVGTERDKCLRVSIFQEKFYRTGIS